MREFFAKEGVVPEILELPKGTLFINAHHDGSTLWRVYAKGKRVKVIRSWLEQAEGQIEGSPSEGWGDDTKILVLDKYTREQAETLWRLMQ